MNVKVSARNMYLYYMDVEQLDASLLRYITTSELVCV